MSVLFFNVCLPKVEDLSAASPATVSRCGMVYMEPDQVGVHPLVQCWLRTLCADLKPIKDDIDGMFNWLVLPSLDFCSKRTQSTLPFSGQRKYDVKCRVVVLILLILVLTSVRSLLSMFDALVKTQLLENPDSSRTEQQLAVIVECLFAFALMYVLGLGYVRVRLVTLTVLVRWTIGANTNAEGRSSFDKFVRMLFDGKALKESTPGLEKAFEGTRSRILPTTLLRPLARDIVKGSHACSRVCLRLRLSSIYAFMEAMARQLPSYVNPSECCVPGHHCADSRFCSKLVASCDTRQSQFPCALGGRYGYRQNPLHKRNPDEDTREWCLFTGFNNVFSKVVGIPNAR